MSLALCSNCQSEDEEVYAKGRCELCYRYLIRSEFKTERPARLQKSIYERRYQRFISKSLTLGL